MWKTQHDINREVKIEPERDIRRLTAGFRAFLGSRTCVRVDFFAIFTCITKDFLLKADGLQISHFLRKIVMYLGQVFVNFGQKSPKLSWQAPFAMCKNPT